MEILIKQDNILPEHFFFVSKVNNPMFRWVVYEATQISEDFYKIQWESLDHVTPYEMEVTVSYLKQQIILVNIVKV